MKPELEIFDVSGRKTGTIPLDIDFLKVTNKVREHHQMSYVISKDGVPQTNNASMGEFLPYYCDLCVDSQGNILVFLMKENPEVGPFPFQVYSPDGKLICRSELDTADFAYSPDSRFDKFDFTDRGIFCILHRRGDELETPRLMRIKIL